MSVGGACLWVVRIDFAAPTAPVTLSEELPLLDSNDDAAASAAAGGGGDAVIPAGLRALVRTLLACGDDTAPFGLHGVSLPRELGDGWENRGLLGSGGFADVIRLCATGGGGGGGGEEVAGKFVRLAKFNELLETETKALLALGALGVPHVPRVRQCAGAAAPCLLAGGRSILLTSPVGARLSVAFGATRDAQPRARLAARLLSHVRAALAGAHAAGLAHGDVRPSNIVAVMGGSGGAGGGGGAAPGDGGDGGGDGGGGSAGGVTFVLIDWGLATPTVRPPIVEKLRGEPAFMSERLLLLDPTSKPPPSFAATKDDDLEAAMWAYFAAVEDSCARPPWGHGDFFGRRDLVVGRREWVREHAVALHAAAVELPEAQLQTELRGAIERYAAPLPPPV